MKHIIVMATLLITIVGCASNSPVAFLRGSDITASDQAPDQKEYSESIPGVGSPELIQRTFVGQPPLIPHAVAKYEHITIDENVCVNCHITDEFKGVKMPKMGASHFSAVAKQADGMPDVNMVRWQCNSCHVVQADAKPLIENTFIGHTAK
ncbi:MAG: nitrate reductase cytochrome c-type subunit [Sulfuritalea sp.]|jgi:cytochrome c-type protein NapB|nr:nitrate reductase cytochrome c-type subunit [Sulfuritalea sp.]